MAKSVIMRTQQGKILHLECHESLPSTHELAKFYASSGYVDGYVVFAEKQTKSSESNASESNFESDHGVYISCILRPSIFASQAGFLGAMSTVALISALEEHTKKQLGIGYVSDIYCEGKKIGKSIVEGKLDSFSAFEYIIVSFYAKLDGENFPPRLSDLVKKVFESENTSISLIVAKNILEKFFSLYPKRLKTPERFMEVYKRKFILSGVNAKYIENGKRRRCKILGIENSDFRLIIESKGKIKHVSGAKHLILPKVIKNKKRF